MEKGEIMSQEGNEVQIIILRNKTAKRGGKFYDVYKIEKIDGKEIILSLGNLEVDPNIKRIGGVILKKDEIIGGVTFKPEHGEIDTKYKEQSDTDTLVELSEKLIEMQKKNDELLTSYLEARDEINKKISEIQDEISQIKSVKTLGQKK